MAQTKTKNPTATNPNSYKEIVALRMGEKMCADHADSTVGAPVQAHTSIFGMGVCYVCAITHNEPKRLR